MAEYSNYNNIFLIENTAKFLKNIKINKRVIKLEESKQPFFGFIYSLKLIKLEILKIYIKINLANGFIQPFKSFAKAPILFDKKLDKNFCLYINYWGLNNLIIKN